MFDINSSPLPLRLNTLDIVQIIGSTFPNINRICHLQRHFFKIGSLGDNRPSLNFLESAFLDIRFQRGGELSMCIDNFREAAHPALFQIVAHFIFRASVIVKWRVVFQQFRLANVHDQFGVFVFVDPILVNGKSIVYRQKRCQKRERVREKSMSGMSDWMKICFCEGKVFCLCTSNPTSNKAIPLNILI
jgi:hypothetical protein